nr:NAD-dependent deacetylase, putative [Entamoeba invadens]
MDPAELQELDAYNGLDNNDTDIDLIAKAMEKAKSVTVLTGAGISVQSGIPDFRSSNGLWKRYDPAVYGTLDTFKTRPELFWSMAEEIHKIDAKPNDVHKELALLEKMGVVKNIITQNVDGLHQMAGSKNVMEIHGNTRTCYCVCCGYITTTKHIWEKTEHPSIDVPKCPKCGGLMKLDVILFGEKLDQITYQSVTKALENTDFLLVIGTSLKVAPCNIIPKSAKQNGAQVAFINCTTTMMDEYADYVVRGDLTEIIPQIASKVRQLRNKTVSPLQRAFLLSYSMSFVIMTMLLTIYNNVFHQNFKLKQREGGKTEMVLNDCETESDALRRHSVPLSDTID